MSRLYNNSDPLYRIIRWYKQNKIDYPWMKTYDPYHVWISEIMLQQTTVNTVNKRFSDWIGIFPDIPSVAKASEETVLKEWEGLGYYTRAKNIHKTAKIIYGDYRNMIPDNYESLVKLPGIGDYTAKAILSIGYEKNSLVFDANVKKIFQRICEISKWNKKTEVLILQNTLPLMEIISPRIINESLMQFGQIVCKSVSPVCSKCPVTKDCKAFKHKTQSLFPAREKKKITLSQSLVFIIQYKSKILVFKNKGSIGNSLYTFPKIGLTGPVPKVNFPESKTLILSHFARWLEEHPDFGRIRQEEKMAVKIFPHNITHYYTNNKELLIPVVISYKNGKNCKLPVSDEAKWLNYNELNTIPFLSAYRKIVSFLYSGKPE